MKSNTIYLKDYQVPAFFIERTDLVFELNFIEQANAQENWTQVTSNILFKRNPKHPDANAHLHLHGHHFSLLSLSVNEQLLQNEDYTQQDDTLTIKNLPQEFSLQVVTKCQPQRNTALEGLYQSSGNFCTQCEAQGFRRITYYLDQPDVLSIFTTKIIADKQHYPVLLSNGNLIEQGEIDQDKHYVVWHDPFPKPSYLFALVAGDLAKISDQYITVSGRKVELDIFVEHHNADKCEHAMQSLKKAMQWDEQRFGLEYDLDKYMIVAVDDFNMGAMENKGLNVFNAKYVLANADTATDKDYENIEAVIGHEYFHNWTGNRVTCRDWFQLSLKEGLTVFRDQEFTADLHSRAVKRIEDVKILRAYQFAEDAGPMAHPIRPAQYQEINNFYTVTVYNKGAEVIRMIHTLIGEDNFRKGLALYFERHDGQAVTTEDFVDAMASASGKDLSQFENWYNQYGTPKIKISSYYDSERQCFELSITQQQVKYQQQNNVPQWLHIPIAMGLLDHQGKETSHQVLELSAQTQTFVFNDISSQPVVSIFREFSAPIILQDEQSAQERILLMQYDTDSFNRWDACQQLMGKFILEQVQYRQQGNAINIFEQDIFVQFMQALASLLNDSTQDAALRALAISLPDPSYLMEQMSVADVDNIYLVRKQLQKTIADNLQEELNCCYQQHQVEIAQYSFNAKDAGDRSLAKVCLSYLLSLQQDDWFAHCYDAYKQAGNMSDRMNYFANLSQYDNKWSRQALQHFEQQWKNDPLVMDKWLSLQAMRPEVETLKTVQDLMSHQCFSVKNPNRVRALIGAFTQNHLAFHRKDGLSYRFIGEQIKRLDSINPQVAARLVKSFCRWRHFDEHRQKLQKEQLQIIAEIKGISPDISEIAEKSLSDS